MAINRQHTPLGIVALGGGLPAALASYLVENNRPFFLAGIPDMTSPAICTHPHGFFSFLKIGELLTLLRNAGCKDIVFAGQFFRPALHKLRVDWKTLRYLPLIISARGDGDNSVMSRVTAAFEKEGFNVISLKDIAPALAAPAGIFAGGSLSRDESRDIETGIRIVHEIGASDVGQALVIDGGRVIAIEAAEGTDAMLARVKDLRGGERYPAHRASGVLVKAAKPQQQLRNDMPVIGPATIAGAAAAGLRVIAVEAGRVLCVDLAAMTTVAEKANITLIGITTETGLG